MNDENKNEPHDKAVDDDVARELEGVPEHLREDADGETDTPVEDAPAKLKGDLEAAMQDVLYARAETQNVRRRLEKDVQDARNYAATGFARDILSVADNLSRALDHVPDELREHEKAKNFIAGIEATQRELEKVFNSNGITRIAAKGMPLATGQHLGAF